MKKKIVILLSLILFLSFVFTGCKNEGEGKNKYSSYTVVKNADEGIIWPDGQFIPTFAIPAENLDTISMKIIRDEEQVTFSALQGLINKTKPRILLLDSGSDEGPSTWPNTEILGLKINNVNRADRYDMVKKYLNEVKGVVLYSTRISQHYRNLAFTVSGIKDLLPMDQVTYDDYKKNGIDLEIVEDLTSFTFKSAIDIYNYLYDNYWEECNKRLLISLDPGDRFHIRDIGTATKSAHVYLDCTNQAEKEVFEKFLKEMEPGNGGVMGWFTTERSGITTVTYYGLSTVPANLYMSGTVYAGTDNAIQIPAVPERPDLENKLYITVYLTDGDNVQYVQRAMRRFWDSPEEKRNRGKVPINWTISPVLADIAPGILNYYYSQASDMECFVSGPSGAGYTMPTNTLLEPGATVGTHIIDESLMDSFTEMTEKYLHKSGLRVITIWDDANDMQRNSYEKYCRYLYGATVQNFSGSTVRPGVTNERLPFIKHETVYEGNYSTVKGSMSNKIQNYDGTAPEFYSYQIKVWSNDDGSNIRTAQIVKLYNELKKAYPDKNFEFVRADHFYSYYSEVNQLPFNLSMLSKVNVTATDNNDNAKYVLDGTPAGESIWVASKTGEQTLTFDLGGKYDISRYVIRHAGDNRQDASLNTKDFIVEVSTDGEKWSVADKYKGNTKNVTDVDIETIEANYLRIRITNPGEDNIARIADVEIYGCVK